MLRRADGLLLPKSSRQFKTEMNVFISNDSNKESTDAVDRVTMMFLGGPEHLKTPTASSFFSVTVPFLHTVTKVCILS